MMKTIFVVGALTIAAIGATPASAQAAGAAAGAALPKCSATVRDQCDQSATSERYALTADQAMKTGGVGDRKSDQAAMGAKAPMAHKARMHHHTMTKHHMMMKKTPEMMTPDATTEPTPK